MNAQAKKGKRTSWSATPRQPAGGSKVSDASLRNALFRRVEEFLRESIASMDDSQLLSVIEAPTPTETIARVVAASPHLGLERADWAQALLRGALMKQDALMTAGGVMSSGEVARLLGITVPGVKQRQRRGKLLAVPTSNGEWGYPARQFAEDGRVREGLPQVLEAFGPDADPWVVLSFLANPVPGSDTGVAFNALSDPEAVAILVEVARTYGEQGAA
ncbi:MAG TPA: hypothetical protein VF771_15585 [Longimicrobiaceae bacterium]